jgi:hypothetical protein
VQTDLPVLHDLNTEKGRSDLGFDDVSEKKWSSVHVIPFRMSTGEDVSCLNLHRPTQPRVLGVPQEMIKRGGFTFAAVSDKHEKNPWNLLLKKEFPDNVIPAFGDANSLQWILHKGIGDDIPVINNQGEKVMLRIVGSISNSIFASELLISADRFQKHFGKNDGYRYLLVSAPAGTASKTAQMLKKNMKDYGVMVRTTSELLAAFAEVNNAYIVTFLMLGGLGFMLGTLGLAAVLVRNIVERKSEYALMLAVGFKKRTLVGMNLFENGILLVMGIMIGSVSALTAVLPYMVSSHTRTAVGLLMIVMLIILFIGLASCTAAASLSMTGDFIPALRRE